MEVAEMLRLVRTFRDPTCFNEAAIWKSRKYTIITKMGLSAAGLQ